MGTLVTLGSDRIEPQSISVTESITPMSVTDTTGEVGTFTIGVQSTRIPTRWLAAKGSQVVITDTRLGTVSGTLQAVATTDGGITTLTCHSRLAALNIYNVRADPYSGTLGGAFAYYFSLAGITTGFTVDASITSRTVAIVGWFGELWYNIKALAAANDCEVALVGNTITVRPVRQYTIPFNLTTSFTPSLPEAQLAQFVEVNQYDTKPITKQLVYPPNGWNSDVQVLTANAGEWTEYTLDLGASVTSIIAPVYLTTIGPSYQNTSVYNVSGDDGLPITQAAWEGAGGKLQVTINPDTISVTVRIWGPKGLPTSAGDEIKVFQIAVDADSGGSSYSTLRIVGTGVKFTKSLFRFPTGISASLSSQDVGVTVDNPFLCTLNQVYGAGARAAKQFTGRRMALTTTLSDIPFQSQNFGNVGGARIWDPRGGRFYRARAATIAPDSIQIGQADDDLDYADLSTFFDGQTYDQVKARYAGLTYEQTTLKGLS